MAAWRFRVIALVASLAGCVGGCRTVPPAPGFAVAQENPSQAGSADASGYDGWLYQRLTGQDKKDSAPVADGSARPQGQVQQASATESTPPGPGETVVTAATLAKISKPEPKKTEDEDSGFSLEALSPANVTKKVKEWTGNGPNEGIARAAYDEGHRLFREKKYDEAAKQFAVAADRWPDTALEEDALFWRAESLFFADRYSSAHDAYEKLLKKYEYSRHLDKAVAREFAIGRYWERFDQAEPHWALTPNLIDKTRPLFDTWGNAQKAYEHVRMNDPTGPLADDALMASANAYFIAGRYEDAALNYDTLRKEYPKSEHQKNAHLLEMEAKQKIYQGALYDGTPLKEVNEIADQTLIRFGPTLGLERDHVIETKNRVVQQKAERDWALAQYYERNHYYGAARYYYKSLLETYPQTQFAEMARERMEEIKAYPDEPPDRLKWLTGLLGPVKKR